MDARGPERASRGIGIWCWDPMARKGCVPCEKKRLKLRLSDAPHTCGYIAPLTPILRDAVLKRREEAVEHKECFHCHGDGFVYEYNAPKYKRTVSVIGDYAITDNRGTRYLVKCSCALATVSRRG